MCGYLDKWVQLGDSEELVRFIIDCLKAIYTRVRHERNNVSAYN